MKVTSVDLLVTSCKLIVCEANRNFKLDFIDYNLEIL